MDAWLARAARMHPDRAALVLSGVELTYAELYRRAAAFGGALRERGVLRGERVALAMGTAEELVVALHGCLLAGMAAVPLDPRLSLGERAGRVGGAVLVTHEGMSGSALVDPAPPLGEAVATILHTSGTSATPRAIALTYENWLWNALGSAIALGFDRQERWLCPLPLAHVGGLSILLRSAIYGTTVVLHERFEAHALAAALMDPEQRITLVSLVPTMLGRLLDAGLRSPPTLRWALLGGSPIRDALLARAAEAGVPVAPTYGMTEACSQIATNGWPLLGVDVELDGAAPASSGGAPVVAEVLVRGRTVAPGSLAPDGWLHTGDLGRWDASGRLTIVGRIADTIVTGGENVSPAEVEAVLLTHPAVADAGVYGRPDPDWGEAVVARVVLGEGAAVSADELRAHCRTALAGFKVPKAVELAAELPRTESGKLRRRELG